jgi:hypothetical protein
MTKFEKAIENLKSDKPGLLEQVFGFVGVISALPSVIIYYILVLIRNQVQALIKKVWK